MSEERTAAFRKRRKSPQADRRVEEEMLIQSVGDAIARLMADHGLDKAELARRLKKSSADVTQLLRGDRNLTLRTIARLAYALGFRVRLKLEPLAAGGGERQQINEPVKSAGEWRVPQAVMRKVGAG